MVLHSKQDYLATIRTRYLRAGKKAKTLILDEFSAICCYNRKYAIRILSLAREKAPPKGGRRPGGRQHHSRRVSEGKKRPGNGDLAILQRLAEHLKVMLLEFLLGSLNIKVKSYNITKGAPLSGLKLRSFVFLISLGAFHFSYGVSDCFVIRSKGEGKNSLIRSSQQTTSFANPSIKGMEMDGFTGVINPTQYEESFGVRTGKGIIKVNFPVIGRRPNVPHQLVMVHRIDGTDN